MRHYTALAVPLALVACLSLTGCCYYELRDTLDACNANFRASWNARRAWSDHKNASANHPYQSAFGHGFRDGYAAVVNGGDGCAPSLPPRCYWNDCYAGQGGKEKVSAYFNGYSQGAYVAQAEGLGSSGRLMVRRPVYPGGSYAAGPMTGPPTGVPLAEPLAAPTTTTLPSPPPPPPATGGPIIPADPGYESYDPNGLYYE